MNCYEKKGITVISVLLVLVVLSILTGIATFSIDYILQNTNENEFMNEYRLVKASVSDYVIRNSGNIDFEETEFDLTNISGHYLVQFYGENKVNNKITLYIIDLEKIGVYNTTYGIGKEIDDVYLYSTKTKNVYYKKGFEYDGAILYKVTN